MTTIEKELLSDNAIQLRNDTPIHEREDFRNEDVTSDPRVRDSELPGWDNADEDDDNKLKDDDISGRDLDTDGADEWDEANVSDKDLDYDGLEDDDEAIADLHQVKNDQFGSLGRSIKNEAEPDPDEIPEEHEADNEELDYPDDDHMEEAKDDEVTYSEQKEVTPPAPESEPKEATLGDVDSTFTDDKHGRTSGRLLDHEPGAGINPPEHGAYNL